MGISIANSPGALIVVFLDAMRSWRKLIVRAPLGVKDATPMTFSANIFELDKFMREGALEYHDGLIVREVPFVVERGAEPLVVLGMLEDQCIVTAVAERQAGIHGDASIMRFHVIGVSQIPRPYAP